MWRGRVRGGAVDREEICSCTCWISGGGGDGEVVQECVSSVCVPWSLDMVHATAMARGARKTTASSTPVWYTSLRWKVVQQHPTEDTLLEQVA